MARRQLSATADSAIDQRQPRPTKPTKPTCCPTCCSSTWLLLWLCDTGGCPSVREFGGRFLSKLEPTSHPGIPPSSTPSSCMILTHSAGSTLIVASCGGPLLSIARRAYQCTWWRRLQIHFYTCQQHQNNWPKLQPPGPVGCQSS